MFQMRRRGVGTAVHCEFFNLWGNVCRSSIFGLLEADCSNPGGIQITQMDSISDVCRNMITV